MMMLLLLMMMMAMAMAAVFVMLLAASCCNWRRPGLPLFGTSFLRVLPSTKSERALCLFFQFLMKKMLLPQPPIMLPLHKGLHTWWQQGGLPEEGENRRTFSRFSCYIKVCIPGGNNEGSLRRAKIGVPPIGFTLRMDIRRPP